jgi:hypothetical protein
VKEKDDAKDDVEVEELTLEDLRGADGKDEEEEKTPGGLRAGGLGPEGSRYRPPDAPRRRTWKPMAVAMLLIIGAFYGCFTIGFQITLESRAEGNDYDLWGRIYDDDEWQNQKEVKVAGVHVSVDGVETTDVSDANGTFFIPKVPGGKFTIRFYKRDWNEAVNTVVTSILPSDVPKDTPGAFRVKVRDLAPDKDRPTYSGTHGIQAEVLDWYDSDTVTLGLSSTAYDEDLRTYKVELRNSEGTSVHFGDYENIVNATVGIGADQSQVEIIIWDPNGAEHARTMVTIEDHPQGSAGWENTDYPQVYAFVRGGTHTDGEDRTVLVHSNDAVDLSYRVDGGEWGDWMAMTDGRGEFTWSPTGDDGDHQVEVRVRNETLVLGTSDTVTMTLDTEAPTLVPVTTSGPAVTDQVAIDPGSIDAYLIRYMLPDGNWSAWQTYLDKVLVPVDDTGSNANITFEAMDRAGNVATESTEVDIKHLSVHEIDGHGDYYYQLKICIPVQIIGIILALFGAWMAIQRRRPTMVMLGAMGALLAGYGLIGAIFAAAALVFVMMSREEFEMPGPAPEE